MIKRTPRKTIAGKTSRANSSFLIWRKLSTSSTDIVNLTGLFMEDVLLSIDTSPISPLMPVPESEMSPALVLRRVSVCTGVAEIFAVSISVKCTLGGDELGDAKLSLLVLISLLLISAVRKSAGKYDVRAIYGSSCAGTSFLVVVVVLFAFGGSTC